MVDNENNISRRIIRKLQQIFGSGDHHLQDENKLSNRSMPFLYVMVAGYLASRKTNMTGKEISAGFFLVNEHILECSFCRCRLADFNPEDDLACAHKTMSPHCSFLLYSELMMDQSHSISEEEKYERVVIEILNIWNKSQVPFVSTAKRLGHSESIIFDTLVRKYLTVKQKNEEKELLYGSCGSFVRDIIDNELNDNIHKDSEVYEIFMSAIMVKKKHANVEACQAENHFVVERERAVGMMANLKLENIKMIVCRMCHQCGSRLANHMCLPCNHLSLCDHCQSKICPLCGESVCNTLKVYYS